MKNLISIVAVFSIILLSGCATNDNVTKPDDGLISIIGIAEETKDGFYVDKYVLTHEEIEKYDKNYKSDDFAQKNLVIKGKIKEVEDDCVSDSGEIVQCRPGKTLFIYDIESIQIGGI